MAKAKKDGPSGADYNNRLVASNRKARFDYELLNSYSAGIVLMGSEIKSLRANRINLVDGFVQDRGGELWLMNVHIATYDQASHFGHKDPMRPRKLLLRKKEIAQIINSIRESSYTAIPTRVFLDNGLAKIEIAVARGKKNYDKRQDIANRDAQRDIRRAMKEEN